MAFGALLNAVYISMLLLIQQEKGKANWFPYMWTLPFDVVSLYRILNTSNRTGLFWGLFVVLLISFIGTTVCVPFAVAAFSDGW